MDDVNALILVIGLSVTSTLAVTFGIGWFRASRRIRELERELSPPRFEANT